MKLTIYLVLFVIITVKYPASVPLFVTTNTNNQTWGTLKKCVFEMIIVDLYHSNLFPS